MNSVTGEADDEIQRRTSSAGGTMGLTAAVHI